MSGEVTKCLLCTAVVAGDRSILRSIGWRQVGDDYVCPECRKITEPEIVLSPPMIIMPTGMPPT
jgi:hypothetical protein